MTRRGRTCHEPFNSSHGDKIDRLLDYGYDVEGQGR
jgi:hypothetical protein